MTPEDRALDLAPAAPAGTALVPAAPPHPLVLIERAMQAGLTSESVGVVEKLLQLARDQRSEEAKIAFNAAFFRMRKNMPEFYADKQAKNRSGEVTFVYCSEQEIAKRLEPHLQSYGFAMLFGQSAKDDRISVTVTLMHEAGHSETRDFTVRSGTPNAMKDGAMCDAGAATTAWRNLMIKMFGLKSRIQENQDVRNEGERITPDKAQYLREQCAELGGTTEARMLTLAGVDRFEDVPDAIYPVIVRAIEANKRAKKS